MNLPAGTLVAGFYSGKRVHCQNGEVEDPAKGVAYTLHSADTEVMVGGMVMTVCDALARGPLRKVQYHNLEPDPQPGAPAHFQLKIKNTAVYRCHDLPAVKKELDAEGAPWGSRRGTLHRRCPRAAGRHASRMSSGR